MTLYVRNWQLLIAFKEAGSVMMPKLTKPIEEFMLACNPLLTGSITRNDLTKVELEMIETCIELLTKKFFTQQTGKMS
jgi:hypothetical protein